MSTDLTTFKGNLTKMIERGEFALPSTVDTNAFRNACIVAFQNNPEIRKCTPETVFTSLRHLAGLGMMPDGKQAAIVRFGGSAQAMPMTAGYIAAAKRSGKVRQVKSDIIYEGETIEVWYDDDGTQRFNHVNEDGSRLNPLTRGGVVLGALAVATMTDGTFDFEVFNLDQIEKRRKASPNQKGDKPTGIWAQWFEEMCTKTVTRRLCQRLPMSAEDMTALDSDPTLMEVETRDVTPNETTEERLMRIKGEREAAKSGETIEGETIEGEFKEGGPTNSEDYEEGLIDMTSPAFEEGSVAYTEGRPLGSCPYNANPEYSNWIAGFQKTSAFDQEHGAQDAEA